MTPEELDKRFKYHAPDAKTRTLHDEIRSLERNFARVMNDLLGEETREKAAFFTNFEQATFWAHAHVARNAKGHTYMPNRGDKAGEGKRCLVCSQPEHGHA